MIYVILRNLTTALLNIRKCFTEACMFGYYHFYKKLINNIHYIAFNSFFSSSKKFLFGILHDNKVIQTFTS